MNSLPRPLSAFSLLAAFLVFSGPILRAQVATEPAAAGPTAPDEMVTLKPFDVVADKEGSYEALNFSSLSGTNRSLGSLPITAEIFNATMLSDLATSDVVDLLNNYATGIGPGEAGTGGPSATGTEDGDRFGLASYSVRGLNAGALHRDGFLSANNLGEGFSYDRLEIIRGPQSLLYGANAAGGIINVVTKKAIFQTTYFLPSAQLDNFGTKRYQFDANVSDQLLGHQVALRVALLDANARQWRQDLSRRTSGQFADLAIELFPATHTILHLSWEEKVNDGIESDPGTLVSGIPTVVPNSTELALLLYQHSPALNSIAGGYITWNNVDSLAGASQASRRDERTYSATLSSQLTPWLQGEFIAAKEPVRLDRVSPTGYTALTAPLTGSNPLNAWAIGYSPTGNTTSTDQQGLRALFTANFDVTRFVKNNLVFGGDIQSSPGGYNFTWSYYQVDANGNYVVNQAQLNTASGGRTAMPVQWVDVVQNLQGFASLSKNSYTVNGVTYVRDWTKHANPAFAAPGNPLGYNGGVSGAVLAANHDQAGYAVLFSDWFDNKIQTMVGGRYDNIGNATPDTGQSDAGGGDSGNAGMVWNFSKPVGLYLGTSTSFTTPGEAAYATDIHGKLLPNGRGHGVEGGFKLNALDGRISGSATVYSTHAVNQNSALSAAAIAATDPTGINGHYYTFNIPSVDYDVTTRGVELELTGELTKNWRVQLGYTLVAGRVGNAVYLPFLYNDQFNVNSAGQVTIGANGTPLSVPVNPATPIAADGKTYASSIPTEVMTVSILKNGDASGNYKASLNPSTGVIQNAAAVGLNVPNVGTGVTGLPISQNQLGFVQPGGPNGLYLDQYGGDHVLDTPRDTVSITTMYKFDRGFLKGASFGLNSRYRTDTTLYYYFDTTGVRRRLLAPDTFSFNLITSYSYPVGRHLVVKTQLNVDNVFNERNPFEYPNAATGILVNANLRTDPRRWVWTNTVRF